MIDVRSGNC